MTAGRGPIDWAHVRERLARAQAGAAASDVVTPERARAIMDERARVLARSPAPTLSGASLDLLVFALGYERYGLETKYVREVVRLVDVTPVPGAPAFVRGVTNLRGEILCVLDAGTLFGLPSVGLATLSQVIVLGTDAAELGLLVERTEEIVGLRAQDLLPAAFDSPALALAQGSPEQRRGAAMSRGYVRGVTSGALIVLDGDALLTDPRLYVDQREASAE